MHIRLSGRSYTFAVSLGAIFCLSSFLLVAIIEYYPPLPGGDDTQFWIYVASGYRESTNLWASVVSFFHVDTPNGFHALLFLLGTLKYLLNPILVVFLVQQEFKLTKIKRYGKIGLAYALLYPTIYFIIGGLYRDPLICTLYLFIFLTLSKERITSKSLSLIQLLYILVLGLSFTLLVSLRPQILSILIISMLYFFPLVLLKRYFEPKILLFLFGISTLVAVSFIVTIYRVAFLSLITSYEGINEGSIFVSLINLPLLGGPLYLTANFFYSFLALNPSSPAYVLIFLLETLPALLALNVFYTYSDILLKNPAYLFLVSFIVANILIVSLSSPNTGTSLRYRYPIFMATVPFALMLVNRYNARKDSLHV